MLTVSSQVMHEGHFVLHLYEGHLESNAYNFTQ